MKKNKVRKPRPIHPFPRLAHVPSFQTYLSVPSPPRPLTSSDFPPPTKKIHQLHSLILEGARVLLDMKAKRVLVYDFAQGIRQLCEISVRMLSSLLKSGFLIPVASEKNIVHYASVNTNRLWFEDPDRSF